MSLAFRLLQRGHHLLQRCEHQFLHFGDVDALLVGKVSLTLGALARERASQVVTAVADTLKVVNLTEHTLNLALRLIGKAAFAHLLEVVRNLILHIVGDALVFLHLMEDGVELFFLRDAVHTHHKFKGSHASLTHQCNFLTRFKERKFGGREQACRNIFQARLIFFCILVGEHLTHKLLNLLHKPDKNQSVEHIECGMECGEQEEVVALNAHHIGHKPANSITCRIEHQEHYHHAKHIEEHVGKGGTARLCVGCERSHECGDGGTDILTHRQSGCLLEAEARNMHIEEHQGNCHSGG